MSVLGVVLDQLPDGLLVPVRHPHYLPLLLQHRILGGLRSWSARRKYIHPTDRECVCVRGYEKKERKKERVCVCEIEADVP